MRRRARRGTRSTAPLIAFAAAMVSGRAAAARRALLAERRAGLERVAAEETALMLVLHAGYPAALEGARTLNLAWPGRARRTREGGPRDWMRRGEARCAGVYGAAYGRLRRAVRELHPDLAVWMIEQGYGRVLSRAGLDPATRELVAVTVLAATGWERQLVSHLLGAVRLGAPRRAIRAAVAAALSGAPSPVRVAAARAWKQAFGT
jgi:4-carboxymuconolactone decarboxylase